MGIKRLIKHRNCKQFPPDSMQRLTCSCLLAFTRVVRITLKCCRQITECRQMGLDLLSLIKWLNHNYSVLYIALQPKYSVHPNFLFCIIIQYKSAFSKNSSTSNYCTHLPHWSNRKSILHLHSYIIIKFSLILNLCVPGSLSTSHSKSTYNSPLHTQGSHSKIISSTRLPFSQYISSSLPPLLNHFHYKHYSALPIQHFLPLLNH